MILENIVDENGKDNNNELSKEREQNGDCDEKNLGKHLQ